MIGMMNENAIVKEYEVVKPLILEVDSKFDNCIRDCNNNYFHTFGHICVHDFKLTNIDNNEIINWTVSDKNMSLYELNEKIEIGLPNGFIFNQINKLTLKSYSNLSKTNIHYYLKLRIPNMHRQFLNFFFTKSKKCKKSL